MFAGRVLRQANAAKSVDWTQAVGPFSLPSYSAKWKELFGSITSKTDFANSVSKTVGTVDFAAFEKAIADKAAVSAIKAEYESKMSANAAAAEDNSADALAKNAKLMEVMNKWSGIADSRITELKTELAKAKETRDGIVDWDLVDYYKHIPGLEAELLAEFENNKYWTTEEEDKLAELDYSKLTSELSEGVLTGPGVESAPAAIGEINVDQYLSDAGALKEQLKEDLRNAVLASEVAGLESGFDAVEKEWEAKHPTM